MLQGGDLHRGWPGLKGGGHADPVENQRRLVQAWALVYWVAGESGYLSGPRRLPEEQVRGRGEPCKRGAF